METETSTEVKLEAGGAKIPVKRIVSHLGFEKCEFQPEPQDKCEACGKANVQMYFSGDGFGEGCYWCLDCVVDMFNENEKTSIKIEQLEHIGHTPHCAARQVFGDGECECSFYG